MKKIISYFIIFNILFLNLSFFTLETAKADTPIYVSDNYFVVTAYYSPLPNQNYYFKWTYEDDIKLNWEWIRWSSWKEVFAWMFAWPKNYTFWTKIYLEWVGIWEISDRWWAIVSTDPLESRWYQYDRIDIWMWFWEEWLARALAWWKKTVKWTVLADSETPINIKLTDFPSPESVLIALNKKQNYLFERYIWPKSDEEEIKILQKIFFEIWLYNWQIDWKYNSIKDNLISYQLKNWIIKNISSDWAWYFWPITRTQVKKDYLAYSEKNKTEIEKKKKVEAQLAQIKKTVETKVNSHIASIWTPKVWDIWENVRTLQKTLKTLGYFKVKDSAIFWDQTKNALIKYQVDKWIVASAKDNWAWVFWPKTKQTLKNELITSLEKQVLKERNLLSYKK